MDVLFWGLLQGFLVQVNMGCCWWLYLGYLFGAKKQSTVCTCPCWALLCMTGPNAHQGWLLPGLSQWGKVWKCPRHSKFCLLLPSACWLPVRVSQWKNFWWYLRCMPYILSELAGRDKRCAPDSHSVLALDLRSVNKISGYTKSSCLPAFLVRWVVRKFSGEANRIHQAQKDHHLCVDGGLHISLQCEEKNRSALKPHNSVCLCFWQDSLRSITWQCGATVSSEGWGYWISFMWVLCWSMS